MAGFFRPGFEYPRWANCGIGSFVVTENVTEMKRDLASFRNVMETRTTVVELGPGSVTVEMEIKSSVGEQSFDSRSTRVILAKVKPEPPAKPKLKKARAVKKGEGSATVTKMSWDELFKDKPWTEGEETVDVAGQSLPCRRMENGGTFDAQDIRLIYWLSDRIPGGIAKYEFKLGPGSVGTTMVTSFEKK
jgi:hypothetical protein